MLWVKTHTEFDGKVTEGRNPTDEHRGLYLVQIRSGKNGVEVEYDTLYWDGVCWPAADDDAQVSAWTVITAPED